MNICLENIYEHGNMVSGNLPNKLTGQVGDLLHCIKSVKGRLLSGVILGAL
jgi:hypothetical protein